VAACEERLVKKVRVVSVLIWFCLACGIVHGEVVSIPLLDQPHDIPAISGELAMPEGPGPFPVVILLHGCGGLTPASRQRAAQWAALYRELGYVTLIPDSFTPRGWYGCRNRDPNSQITLRHRVVDAYSALAFLAAQPFIDKERVVLEGMSQGGGAVLRALTTDDPTDQHGTFAAGIAFYPPCLHFVPSLLRAPVLILIGEKDGTTPAGHCPSPPAAHAPVDYRLTVYAGATHAYDVDIAGRYFRGDYREFHREATADSARQIRQFLSAHVPAAQR
jgi:dienelactone hydrolase